MKNPDNFNSYPHSFKVDFSPAQLCAIRHLYGPMMVLAGPGSGKTAVITGRLEYLTAAAKIPAGNILAVTFSKKAAFEMEQRFKSLELSLSESPVFGTFHSVFYSIIRKANAGTGLRAASSQQKLRFIKSAVLSLNLDTEDNSAFYASIADEISRVKGNILDINGYEASSLPSSAFRYIYKKYNSFLAANSLVDFDDMQLECFKLLLRDPDLLSNLQKKYRFILVDEFQDINILQYEILSLLEGKAHNIFVVGDDDQSIYGFRGARFELMRRFLKDHRDARQVVLDINYRSCPQIVFAAGKVIQKNEERFQKNIRPLKGKEGKGNVSLIGFSDIKAQADQITDQILSLNKAGTPLSQIAVLFRNNADTQYLQRRLSLAGLPVSAKKKSGGLYTGFISRDIIAYADAACLYPECRLSDILLIMNRPSRYISRRSLAFGEQPFSSMKSFYRSNERMIPVIKKFEEDIKMIYSLPAYAALKYIENAAGYNEFLKEYAKETSTDLVKHEKVLKKLEEDAAGFKTLSGWAAYAKKQAEYEETDENACSEREKDAVNIMTIHASKGLEWSAVFIPTCNDNIIPGKNDQTLSALEEERRVLYVAMTRAKDFLQISYVERLRNKSVLKSRFLKALDD